MAEAEDSTSRAKDWFISYSCQESGMMGMGNGIMQLDDAPSSMEEVREIEKRIMAGDRWRRSVVLLSWHPMPTRDKGLTSAIIGKSP
jgi:hypothetical protein